MSEEVKTVEAKIEPAVVQQEVTVNTNEVDYEAVLKQKDSELEQVRTERENYRKGMLKAKGKLPEEDELDSSTPEGVEALIDRKVQEKFLSTKEAQIQAEKDKALAAVLKQNREYATALKNRGQITDSSAAGSNSDRPVIKTDSYFSPEQIQSLKAKGWSDAKIETAKQNMLKGTQAPK